MSDLQKKFEENLKEKQRLDNENNIIKNKKVIIIPKKKEKKKKKQLNYHFQK
jgi:hypothetical protein